MASLLELVAEIEFDDVPSLQESEASMDETIHKLIGLGEAAEEEEEEEKQEAEQGEMQEAAAVAAVVAELSHIDEGTRRCCPPSWMPIQLASFKTARNLAR